MSYFRVLKSGILSTIQDLGRFGYVNIGITNSGAMDEEAFLWANRLLQNNLNSNMLEITYGDFELKSYANTTFCITGAEADIWLNKSKINRYRCYNIKKGDILKIGFAKRGVRLYLAIKGGFLDKKELNSYSTTIKEGIKAPIKKGDILKLKPYHTTLKSYLKEEFIPRYKSSLTLRVLLGYESDIFSKDQIDKFFSSTYKVKSHNRMGYLLSGEEINLNKEIISNPISFGAIQITPNAEPIILLKERQTIGGYPKIGSVIPIDCFKLAQLKEGDSIKFKPISLKEATNIIKDFYSYFVE